MLSPDIRQFLEDNKVTDIDEKYNRLKIAKPQYSKEWLDLYMVHRSMASDMKQETLVQFLTQQGTAHAMFMLGYMLYYYGSIKNILLAIPYFELYCKMDNPDKDGFSWLATCYDRLYYRSESLSEKQTYGKLYFQNLQQSAAVGENGSWICIGNAYQDGLCGIEIDLREARHYYKLQCDSGQTRLLDETKQKLNTVEIKLLDEFEIQLDKADYLLAYELKVKHDRSGQQDLQKLIEKDYSEVIDLPKVLCNIIVSYLLYKN